MTTKGKQTEKHKAHIKTKDFYDHYAGLHFKGHEEKRNRVIIDRSSPFYVDSKTYGSILEDFNLMIRDEIVNESKDFKMPSRLGTLGIRKKKRVPYVDDDGKVVNNLPIDWNKTRKLWESSPKAKAEKKLVRFYNEHSNGFVAKVRMFKVNANYKNKSIYTFIPTRTVKSMISENMTNRFSKVDYFEL